MHRNELWEEFYENRSARDEREALALRLLAEGKIEEVRKETGMSREEFRSFLREAEACEIEHLCVSKPRGAE